MFHTEDKTLEEETQNITCICSDLQSHTDKNQPRDKKEKSECYCEDCRLQKNENPTNSCKSGKNKQKPKISSNSSLSLPSSQGNPILCQSCKSIQGVSSEKKSTTISNRPSESCSSSDHSQDNGYSSENNNGSSVISSPEGSDIACSDGWCNHEGECSSGNEQPCSTYTLKNPPKGSRLTLQEMLENSYTSEDECTESLISAEEVREFQSRKVHIAEQRQQLRQTLKFRFDQLCQATIPLSLTFPN